MWMNGLQKYEEKLPFLAHHSRTRETDKPEKRSRLLCPTQQYLHIEDQKLHQTQCWKM